MDGHELVLVNQKQGYHIDVFNADSGDFVYTVTMPAQNGFSQNKLSYDSKYVITGNDQVVQIYERHSSRLIYELEQVQSGCFFTQQRIYSFGIVIRQMARFGIWKLVMRGHLKLIMDANLH